MSLASYLRKEVYPSGIAANDECSGALVVASVLQHHIEDFNEGLEIAESNPSHGRVIALFSQKDVRAIVREVGMGWKRVIHFAIPDNSRYNKFVDAVSEVLNARV